MNKPKILQALLILSQILLTFQKEQIQTSQINFLSLVANDMNQIYQSEQQGDISFIQLKLHFEQNEEIEKCLDLQIEFDQSKNMNQQDICRQFVNQIVKLQNTQQLKSYKQNQLSLINIEYAQNQQLCNYKIQNSLSQDNSYGDTPQLSFETCNIIQDSLQKDLINIEIKKQTNSLKYCKCVFEHQPIIYFIDVNSTNDQQTCCKKYLQGRVLQQKQDVNQEDDHQKHIEKDDGDSDDDNYFDGKHFKVGIGNLGISLFICQTIMYFALQGDDRDNSLKKESVFEMPYISINRQQSQISERVISSNSQIRKSKKPIYSSKQYILLNSYFKLVWNYYKILNKLIGQSFLRLHKDVQNSVNLWSYAIEQQ